METPNDFYSVLIQTSGVIVAIIGGFLSSSWFRESARRLALANEMAELEVMRQRITSQIIPQLVARRRRIDTAPIRRTAIGGMFVPDDAEVQAKREEKERLAGEIESNKREVELIESRIKDIANSRRDIGSHQFMALIPLMTLVIFGIFIPMLLMASSLDDARKSAPLMCFALFWATLFLSLIPVLWPRMTQPAALPEVDEIDQLPVAGGSADL